jgi:hypothetical protein
MVLKLTSDEVREVHKALSAAHRQVLWDLSRVEPYVNREAGLELCRRKWKLETLLRQLDQSDDPPPVLELVPAVSLEPLHSEAA